MGFECAIALFPSVVLYVMAPSPSQVYGDASLFYGLVMIVRGPSSGLARSCRLITAFVSECLERIEEKVKKFRHRIGRKGPLGEKHLAPLRVDILNLKSGTRDIVHNAMDLVIHGSIHICQ